MSSAEEFGQPVHTVEDLSKMFNVSTKTISRWRQQGLVSRKFIFDGGRKRVGFLHTSVDQFVKRNRDKVKRGERFSQLSEGDKDEIIDRARTTGPRRRMPRRGDSADCQTHGPQRRDHSLHDQAV